MNRGKWMIWAAALLSAPLLWTGCATVENRIERNRDYFDSLPIADQARIRGGKIALGYTPVMVQIALGDPARRLVRRQAGQPDMDVWLYVDSNQRYVRQRADIDSMSIGGGTRVAGGSVWMNVLEEREYVRTRVVFLNGRAVEIEEEAASAAAAPEKTAAPPPAAPVAAPAKTPAPAPASASPNAYPTW